MIIVSAIREKHGWTAQPLERCGFDAALQRAPHLAETMIMAAFQKTAYSRRLSPASLCERLPAKTSLSGVGRSAERGANHVEVSPFLCVFYD
jgi:hypothetical protein